MAKQKSGKYKCQKCGMQFDALPEAVVRCPSCANKVLLKVRQPVSKELKAR